MMDAKDLDFCLVCGNVKENSKMIKFNGELFCCEKCKEEYDKECIKTCDEV